MISQSAAKWCADIKFGQAGTMHKECFRWGIPVVFSIINKTYLHFINAWGKWQTNDSFSTLSWTILEHLAYSPDLAIFTPFPLWSIIFLATNLRVKTMWKQLLRGDWNRRAQNSTIHELTNQSHNWTNTSIIVRTLLKNKVVSADNTCYLFCSNGNIY
jgi:hypothetical protein